MAKNIYKHFNIPVSDSFIAKFAHKYIAQRSKMQCDISDFQNKQVFKSCGFDTNMLEDIIT